MKEIYFLGCSLEEAADTFAEKASERFFEKFTKLYSEKESIEFLTRQETAQFLKITLPTLHAWTKTGKLTSYRLGTKVRYKKSEVILALEGKNLKSKRY
jgi:excisionase family DNA binding protein